MAKKSDSVLRIRRIFEIHKVLRSREGVSGLQLTEYLIEKGFEANERIVASDIADLRLLGASVSANRHKGYWYTQPFSLLETLEGVDSGNTNEILAFVRQRTNEGLYIKNLANLLIRLEQEVRNPELDENPYIQFHKVELKNLNKLDSYYRFITEKRVLDISYKYFGSEVASQITILPILLREYNNRWTLVAYSKEKNMYQNFALDRIENERFSTISLTGDNTFNSNEYFKNVIGNSVYKAGQVEYIVFKINKRRAYYVDTKKWHHSQINRLELEDETSMTFSINIIPNPEFWAKVMEHIEDITILEPEWMVGEFKERVRKVWERVEN